MSQKASLAMMSEGSYLLLARACLIPPRSTARSNPTRSKTLLRTEATTLASRYPTRMMSRAAASLGTKVITFDQALETPPWKSTASGMNELLWLRGTSPVQAGTSGPERALATVLVDEWKAAFRPCGYHAPRLAPR